MDHSGRISYSGKWPGTDTQAFFTLVSLSLKFLSSSCSLYAPICRRKAYRYAGVTATPPANYLADCRSKISGRISVGALSILPTLGLSGQFMVLAQPVGHTDGGGIIGSYIGLIFLIRHICGCWGLGFCFDRKSDYCFSLHPGGGFLLYTGLDFIAGIPLFEDYQTSIQFWEFIFIMSPCRGLTLLAMSFILSPSFSISVNRTAVSTEYG